MVLDDKFKTRMKVICFIPAICFLISFVYLIILILPSTTGGLAPKSGAGIVSRNYDTLFALFAASAIITAPVFIYCLVIIARLKTMNSATKMKWILLLSIMAPIASVFFWIHHIKDAPKYMPVYPDIS